MHRLAITNLWAVALAIAVLMAPSCKREDPMEARARLGGSLGVPPSEAEAREAAQAQRRKPTIPEPAKKASPNDFGEYACRLMKGCYSKHGAYGQVGGRITISVDAVGKALSAAYDNGTAPGPVKECIVAAGKQIQVTGFDAGAGDLVCEYGGQLMAGGIEMMSKSWKFIPRKP